MKRVDEIEQLSGGCAPILFRKLGRLQNNVYCIDDGAGGVVVVDPEYSAEYIMEMVEGRPVSALFVTHKHHDHIGALYEMQQKTGAPVYASAIDAPGVEHPTVGHFGQEPVGCKVDVRVAGGDTISVGAQTWRVLHTPGHTKGSICFYLDPAQSAVPQGAPLLVSGDTLFCGTIGRTDFEGGSMAEMRTSLRQLGTLPNNTLVLPGHDALTTIGAERFRVIEALGGTR